jgi:hypothetical protein
MYIIENLKTGKKISLSNNDLELVYEGLTVYQDNAKFDNNDDVADQVSDLIDKFYELG